jgi:hypothetical protein
MRDGREGNAHACLCERIHDGILPVLAVSHADAHLVQEDGRARSLPCELVDSAFATNRESSACDCESARRDLIAQNFSFFMKWRP